MAARRSHARVPSRPPPESRRDARKWTPDLFALVGRQTGSLNGGGMPKPRQAGEAVAHQLQSAAFQWLLRGPAAERSLGRG